jgi:hypothetical protein
MSITEIPQLVPPPANLPTPAPVPVQLPPQPIPGDPPNPTGPTVKARESVGILKPPTHSFEPRVGGKPLGMPPLASRLLPGS